jgi:F-type H+/Na+-transporting ATPase subunit alpha
MLSSGRPGKPDRDAACAQRRRRWLGSLWQLLYFIALADGLFDPLPAEAIEAIRERVAAYLDAHVGESVAAVTQTGALDDKTRAALTSAVHDLATEVATALQQKAAAP